MSRHAGSFLIHARRHSPLWWAVAGGCSAVVAGTEVQRKAEIARCEATGPPTPESETNEGAPNDYPNFLRHGPKAVLPRILTPQLYEQLKDRRTPKFGVTLEDMISAGVMLPWGANPPRGIGGVYAGDADSYKTFAPLILPLVEECHGVRLAEKGILPQQGSFFRGAVGPPQQRLVTKLRRHQTNLDPEQILDTKIDPTGDYILYTRMRLARNLNDFAFGPVITRSERRRIEKLFRHIVEEDFRPLHGGAYLPIHSMTNQQHEAYISRRICFMDPDEYKLAAKLGRDWPDARGIYCTNHWNPKNTTGAPPPEASEIDEWEGRHPNIIMWCNYDDHFWIIGVDKGGNVQRVFTCLSDAVRRLELGLVERDHSFVMDPKLGFLASSPSNVGTALRASMSVKLVRLGKERPELFQEILHRLHLEAKSDYAETDQRYTGIFDIANAERLGRTEVQLINLMILGISKLIELEKKLERGETVKLEDVDNVFQENLM